MSNELHRCVATGNLEGVKQLEEGGANTEELDDTGKTAVMLASTYFHSEIVAYLVEHGADRRTH
jgi:ankyrin repeat protein